ncbi:MAG TPA: protein kinase, partial [Ktedonobacteraceae bacterium]
MDALLGTNLGGYTLKGLIGSGGMGTVYLAEDPAIGQQVAIKLVHTDSYDVSESTYTTRASERFRQEARAIAALDHPHILPLYRYGEEETTVGPRAYIVMQYRPEGSLADWLRGRAGLAHSSMPLPPVSLFSGLPVAWPLAPGEVAEYIRQAASALQYAHDKGIIHRDVKPANFLLRTDVETGTYQDSKVLLLLSDFGLAEFYASSSSTTGAFGTPTYMSPEQFDGHSTPASDQYALAIIAYYLLAGRLPFEGEPIHLMRQHLDTAPPSILTYAPSLPPEVDRVLAQALAKQPIERFPSINRFAQAFAQALDGQMSAQPQHQLVASKALLRSITNPRLTAFKPPYQAPESPVATRTLEKPVHEGENHVTPGEMKTPPDPLLTPLVQAELAARSAAASPASSSVQTESASSTPSPVQAEFAPPTSSSVQTETAPPSPPSVQAEPAPPTLPSVQAEPLVRSVSASSTLPPVQAVAPQRRKRRSALGCIMRGTAALVMLGTGAGAGLYFNIADIDNRLGVPQLRQSPTPKKGDKQTQPVHPPINYTLQGHTGEVTSVAWSPDGAMLASASVDTTVRLWNSSTHKTTQTYRGHNHQVLSVAWNNTGDQLASGGLDNTVQVWNTMAQMTHGPFDLGAAVNKVTWANDGPSIFASTSDNTIHDILLSNDTVVPTPINLTISTLAISPNGHSMAIGTMDGSVVIFMLADLTTPGPHPIYSSHSH